MSRDERLRVLLVSVLALGVMGGVVVSAVLARRASSSAEDPAAALPRTASRDPARRASGRGEMPGGCEVEAGAPPAVALDLPGDRLDLGAHRQGEVVERDVTVRNTGSGVLCVQDVETGCGCVKAEWIGDKHVPPAAAGTVRVKVDTAGREGTQEKAVRLYTNVPDRKVVEFKTHVEVRLGLVVASTGMGGPTSFVAFGQKPPGRPATATIRLKCPRDEPEWKVLAVESTATEGPRTAFTWELAPVEPNDAQFRVYDLKVTHPGRAETGIFPERMRVTTSHPERRELFFDTQLHVVTKFYTGPVRASFGFVRARDPVGAKTVYVMAGEAGTPFTLKGATVVGEGFRADAPRQTKEGWAIDVRYDGVARPAGRLAATLRIEIEDPELPLLQVPLEAQVMGE